MKNSLVRMFPAILILGALGAGVWSYFYEPVVQASEITVYKSPSCGCCGNWVDHVRDNGFSVKVVNREDLTSIKRENGVPSVLQSCHTALVDGYVVEGHVPANDIIRLLTEKPKARGLAVPGMPIGSPGMEQGDEKEPYPVVIFGDSGMDVYARY